VQQKTTKTDTLVPCIGVIQGRIVGWNVIWMGRGETVNIAVVIVGIISR